MSGNITLDIGSPTGSVGSTSGTKAPSLSPEFDLDDYRADIADLELTEAQETEFLETLWSIMGHFARLGFSADVCGLIFAEFNEASAKAAGNGKLAHSTNKESASTQPG